MLTHNYRSTQPILNISKTLIERNSERLINKFEGLSKNLVSSRIELMSLLHAPTIVEYKTAKDEMADITNKVQTLFQQGIEPGRIAVIFKENKYGEDLIKYFRLKDIPVLHCLVLHYIFHKVVRLW